MSRFRCVVPVVLLLVLIPASASAQGLFRWLGRLSGPGPFWGASVDRYLKCLPTKGTPKPTPRADPQQVHTDAMMMPGITMPCPDTTLDDKHLTIYLNVTGAVAENNPLNYGDVGTQEESTAVRLLRVGASLDWTAHRTFDIGTGAGISYFAGPRFDNFVRPYVQPLRTAFRPLMLCGAATDNDGWLIVSANWQILLGEIDGADFGAPLDSFRERNEHIPEIGVTIDFVRLVKRFKIGQKKSENTQTR
jgi:hypothetical protein